MINWLIFIGIFVALWEILFIVASFLFGGTQEDFLFIKFISFFFALVVLYFGKLVHETLFLFFGIKNIGEMALRGLGIGLVIFLFILINWCIFQLIQKLKTKLGKKHK